MSGRSLALALLVAAVPAMASTPLAAQTRIDAPAGDWRLPDHPAVAFPDAIDEYRRISVIGYDEDNFSVSYKRVGAEGEALVSLYVYREAGACDASYAGARAAITQRYADARLVRESDAPPADRSFVRTARFAARIPPEVIAGGTGWTEIYLHCDPKSLRAIKYRATSGVEAWLDDAPRLLARLDVIALMRGR